MTVLLILGLIVSIIGFIVMRPDDYDGNNPGGVDRVPWKERKQLRNAWEERGLDYYQNKNESHERG
jgi:hypothetical protein